MSSGDDAYYYDTTDLAVLLNEIYAVRPPSARMI
jgi:hypothetical protein